MLVKKDNRELTILDIEKEKYIELGYEVIEPKKETKKDKEEPKKETK